MALRNGPAEFGLVTRVIHWTMMVLVIGQLALGLKIESIEPGLANLWLYGLHKTLGFLVLALILIRIAWHIASPPPPPLGPRTALFWAARAVPAPRPSVRVSVNAATTRRTRRKGARRRRTSAGRRPRPRDETTHAKCRIMRPHPLSASPAWGERPTATLQRASPPRRPWLPWRCRPAPSSCGRSTR